MTTSTWTNLSLDDQVVPRADVAFEDLDGEVLLYDPERRTVHLLNATAGVLWRCLDGDRLGAVAADVAEAYQMDPGVIADQTLDMVRDLGRRWLLDGVAGEDALATDDEGCHETAPTPAEPGALQPLVDPPSL